MMNDKTKMLCLLAFMLTASGCGSGNGEEDNLVDPQAALNGVISANGADATNTANISQGIATPVASVSSLQMDAFVDNPLVTVIPTELNGGTLTGLSTSYITNPLAN